MLSRWRDPGGPCRLNAAFEAVADREGGGVRTLGIGTRVANTSVGARAGDPRATLSDVNALLPRLLVALALTQVLLIFVPLPTWTLWMARFAAIESCLFASVLGLTALFLGSGQPVVQVLAVIAVVGGLTPALGALPVYRAEHQSFSLLAWLTGGPTPDIHVDRDVALAPGLAADVYRAPGAGPHPWVMVVHGGSWRSGDKGDSANIGVIARRPEFLPLLRAQLTSAAVKQYFSHLVQGEVERFEVPGIQALNFLLHQALGGGGMASLRVDPLAKGYAQMLLDFPVAVPEALAALALP